MTDWRAVRRLVPEVLGALVRRYGHFDACEDAVPTSDPSPKLSAHGHL